MTPTSTGPDTTEVTPAIVPIRLPGYEDLEVRDVCILVTQAYPQIDEDFPLPLAEGLARTLEAMGVGTAGPDDSCDATLVVDVVGEALGKQYVDQRSGERFTGYTAAAYTGSGGLEAPGRDLMTIAVSGRTEPSAGGGGARPDAPTDAPFWMAFQEPMVTVLGYIWDPAVVVETIGTTWSVQVTKNWLADAAPEITSKLLEMRSNSRERISVYFALAEIVTANAVPDEQLSIIVRSIIDDLRNPDDATVGGALRAIANAPFEGTSTIVGYFEDDSHWDATRWAEWADAEGY